MHALTVFTVASIVTESGALPEIGVTRIKPPTEGTPAPPLIVVHWRDIAAAVRGPTCPNPVVAGVPEETILNLTCQRLTAASVRAP